MNLVFMYHLATVVRQTMAAIEKAQQDHVVNADEALEILQTAVVGLWPTLWPTEARNGDYEQAFDHGFAAARDILGILKVGDYPLFDQRLPLDAKAP